MTLELNVVTRDYPNWTSTSRSLGAKLNPKKIVILVRIFSYMEKKNYDTDTSLKYHRVARLNPELSTCEVGYLL